MPKYRALLIGVPEYDSDAIVDLPFIRNDIIKLEKALESSGYHVRSVGLKENPTANLIKQQIHKFCVKEKEPGETLIICFSGHGLHYDGIDYLVPFDAYTEDITNIASYLVPLDFTEVFENSAAAAIIFFIDACREGIELGSESVLNIVNWGKGKLKSIRNRDVATIFSCEPGEVSRYVAKPDGFSFFSRALAEVIQAECQASTFEEVIAEIQIKLNALTDSNDKPRQTVRVHLETFAGENRLSKRTICKGSKNIEAKSITEDSWYQSALFNEMWNADSLKNDASIEDLRSNVSQLVAACRKEWSDSIEALPNNTWRDERYPIRIIELIAFHVSRCGALKLSPAEVALLSIVPFIHEAVLAAAVKKAVNADPLSLKNSGNVTGFRASLEMTHLSLPQFVRKAQSLKENKQIAEHDAIAIWLMNRCILREPYVWMDKSQEGYISDNLMEAILLPSKNQSRHIKESLTKNRLLEMALCINSNPERIERSDRPRAFKPEAYVAPSSQHQQVIREKLLAYLLTLFGWMAIDVRMLHEVIIDHIGLSDPITSEDVLRTINDASWVPDAGGKSLQAICRHPAVDLALHEHVQQANVVLEAIRKKIHAKEDGMDILDDLPLRLTAHEICPESTENEMPLYETPHLRFQLAHNEIRELLMGEQLYGDPALAIRELYQNALDACRYRQARIAYLERMRIYAGPKWEGHIIFRQGIEDGRHYIECEDNGIGMGRHELADAFSCAGKRFADMPEFIEEQAEWLRCDPPIRLYPNSQFGIGVFSYFMLADELSIETCRLDRKGNPGENLIIQISGSGSLFRVRPFNKHTDAGTRIRLYLNKTQYKEKWGGQKDISCLDIMRDQLWVSEFTTDVVRDDEMDTWIPGKLHKKFSGEDSILTPKKPGLWWIKTNSNHFSHYHDGSWFGDGKLLADGIDTESHFICAIIDLNQAYRPKLTIDRKKIVEWDRRYATNLVRDQIQVLVENQDWLSYEWLCMLEEVDHKAAGMVVNSLISKDESILIRLKENQDLMLPLNEIGCFSPDYFIIESASIQSDSKRVAGIFDKKKEIISEIRKRIPRSLLINRIEILTKYGLSVPKWLIAETEYYSYDNKLATMPILQAGDSIVLSSIAQSGRWNRHQVSASQILIYAKILEESIDESVKRLIRLSSIGFSIPPINHYDFSDIEMDEQDYILISEDLDGQIPYIKDNVSIIHILRATGLLKTSIKIILSRLRKFAPLGLKVPDIELNKFDDFALTKEDVILISEVPGAQEQKSTYILTGIHILKASRSLNESVGCVLRRLQRLSPFGLVA
ncbi:MAG: caspase family protein, partial [Methanothrix sp.]|nr:caspase family protein [Methanothrix sp.]